MVAGAVADEKSPLFVFAGGGTGGHLYPALAIADAIREPCPLARFRFFGTQRAVDRRILDVAGYDLVAQHVPAPGARGQRAPWHWPRLYQEFRRLSLTCRAQFLADRPVVVVGSGGISSIPALREAARLNIPTALLNPDALPGRANRYLAARAGVVFVQWDEAADHFRRARCVEVTGCPVRSAFNRASRAEGLRTFDLREDRLTLLITGASLGARTVNEAVLACLSSLETMDGWQILHLTGEHDFDRVRQAYERARLQARVLAYTDRMPEALAAADLVLGRAGASTLAELTAVGKASILMPYPYHRDQHQLANARCLVRASAARIVHDRVDSEANAQSLRPILRELMTDHQARAAMAEAAQRTGRGQAASLIADRLMKLAAGAVWHVPTGR